MEKRTVVTFRSTRDMDRLITRLMMERNLDRTSIMKLALYMLGGHMSRAAVRKMDIREVVEELETRVPRGFPKFAAFATEQRRRRRAPRRRRATAGGAAETGQG